MGSSALDTRGAPAARLSPAASHEVVVWLLFILAFLVRIVVIAQTIGLSTPASLEPAADSRIHIALVHNLLAGRGYSLAGAPTAITPPLYVYFLAGLYWLTGDPSVVRIVQAILGALGCVVMYALGRKLFDAWTGLIAGAVLAVYPLPAYLAGLHLTENLFLLLLLLVLWWALRVADHPASLGAAALGCMIGLAALTRAMFIAFVPFLFVWAVTVWGIRHTLTYRIVGLAVAGLAVVVLPWTVRNGLVFREIVPIQSNGGLVFWAGNNPAAAGGLVWPSRRTWTAGPPPDDGRYGWRGLTLAQDNRRYIGAALAWIRGHPGAYGRLLWRKLQRLYGFDRTSNGGDVRVPLAPAILESLFMALAFAGVCMSLRRWRTVSLFLTLIVFTNVIVLLFSGGTRYTIPMVPSVALFAAVAIARASAWLLGPRWADRSPWPAERPSS
jgi:4-amino-4-deoxy-L-arabinose transferase-like glycosyltransferase